MEEEPGQSHKISFREPPLKVRREGSVESHKDCVQPKPCARATTCEPVPNTLTFMEEERLLGNIKKWAKARGIDRGGGG